MPTADRERRERIYRLFDEVVDLPTHERAEIYAITSPDDPDLTRDVEDLVLASFAAPSFLDRPASESELEGRMAGPWRIDRLLASGGMSDVYLGVRDDAEFVWHAAIKVLRPEVHGVDATRHVLAEQKILAALSHPNIVVLLDTGTLADGRLYLATELIEGVRIDRYCDVRRLDIRQRLLLFLQVCAAVQHAHQRLVLHCDLKPSNILVTGDGIPKLLDFGIATLLGPSRRDPTGGRLTLGYASPEQIDGEVLAATTDVWTLGVLLYELVAGRRPFPVEGTTPVDVARSLHVHPPPTGKGDLDAVIRKALEPDVNRRYQTVEHFAADICRYMEHRPVTARPGSSLKRVALFVRRNRLASAAAVAACFSIVVGIVGIYRGMMGAREEARLGWRAHSQAVEVSRFLEDLMEEGNRTSAFGAGSREALLDAAAEKVERSFARFPETEGRLRMAIARLYLDMDLAEKAAVHLRRALVLMSEHRGFGMADRRRAEDLLALTREAATTRPSTPR